MWRWNPREKLLSTVVSVAAAAITGATTVTATPDSSADGQGVSAAPSAHCLLRARTT